MDYSLEQITSKVCKIRENSTEGNTLTFMNSNDSRKILKDILSSEDYNSVMSVWGDNIFIPDVVIPEIDSKILDDKKEKLIADMSDKCHEVIDSGFDAQLSDENIYHFSLKIEDQLMIQALALKVKSGETILPYHADGENCRYFSPEEIELLYSNMENIITYNTTYFNSLRDYILNITDEITLNKIEWGIDIPEEYQSDVLKDLLSNM